MNIEKEIEQYPVRLEIPVLWGDMDSAKHVNNVVYLRWTEGSRVEFFRSMEMDATFNSLGAILGWQDCKYIFPMTYPDTAIVVCKAKGFKEDRMILESRVYSKNNQRLSVISHQHIIPYDYINLKKIELPDLWKKSVTNIQGIL